VESLAGLSISENNSHRASAISGTDLCTFVSGVLSHALGAILGGNAYCRMATKTSVCPFGIALFKIEGEGETVRQKTRFDGLFHCAQWNEIRVATQVR